MKDVFFRGLWREPNIALGVVVTTQLCREAQKLHDLAGTSAIALGRLMTATALTTLIHEKKGSLSLQVLSNGRLRQIYTDVTHDGAVRGYVRPTDLGMPLLEGETVGGRRAIGHALGDGLVSMIRSLDNEPYAQSSADLQSGEIDADVEHFLAKSDQVQSVLVTDVLLLDDEQVQAAGGVLAQAMPGSDPSRLASIREGLQSGRFADRLGGVPTAADLFAGLFPGAERLEPPVHVHWQCRCSIERVIASIRMLEPADLADLVNRNSSVAVTCDFCRRVFDVEPAQIREAYEGTIRGNG